MRLSLQMFICTFGFLILISGALASDDNSPLENTFNAAEVTAVADRGEMNRWLQDGTSSPDLWARAARAMDVPIASLLELADELICAPRGTDLYKNSTVLGEPMAPWTAEDGVQVVCFPGSSQQVVEALRWSRRNGGVAISPIGGGHGSWGYCYSNALGLSMDQLDDIVLDEDNQTLTVGSGVRLGTVIDLLTTKQYVAATGACEDVGYVGWTMGGGFTAFAASIGLGVDNVISFEIVLANQTVVLASADDNADLFWALRGAGHQSFGIVTRMTTKVYPLKTFAMVSIVVPQFPVSYSASVLAEWEKQYTTNSTWIESPLTTYEINSCQSMCAVPFSIAFTFIYMDDSSSALSNLEALLEPFLLFIGESNILNSTAQVLTFDGILQESGIGAPALELWPQIYIAKEGLYIRNRLGASGWESILSSIITSGNALIGVDMSTTDTAPSMESTRTLDIEFRYKLEPYAGLATAVSPASSAFVHRNTLGDLTIEFFIPNNASDENPTKTLESRKNYDKGMDWLDSMWGGDSPLLDGYLVQGGSSVGSFQAYQNYAYPRYGSGDSRWPAILAYYGENACRLVQLKNTYDPELIFDFGQGIPLKPPLGSCHNDSPSEGDSPSDAGDDFSSSEGVSHVMPRLQLLILLSSAVVALLF